MPRKPANTSSSRSMLATAIATALALSAGTASAQCDLAPTAGDDTYTCSSETSAGDESERKGSALEFGGGVVSRVNETLSVFAVGDVTRNLGGERRRTLEGQIGARLDW
ncbi:hypothetical protein [Luteimonas sp. R10]|uniref:hypothetical protein n=1 Tax=Luteimonas sp. R10 TaxID=3108176 RepID=UPI003092EDD8|nr:hypothetical protein U3649_10935 [Luteimonas sp. R10]